MSAFTEDIIRLAFDVESKRPQFDVITEETPEMWRNNDVRFQLGFFRDGVPLDGTPYNSVTLFVKELGNDGRLNPSAISLMKKSIGAGEITPIYTLEEWDAGLKQHCSIAFSAAETRLDLRGIERTFWLAAIVLTSGGQRITAGATSLKMIHDGDDETNNLPPTGSSIIPNGATYNGSGQYVLNGLTANRWYSYTLGTNETKLTNGSEDVTTARNWQAQNTFATLVGTASTLVTATVRTPVFLTMDELDARYQKKITPWALSPNGQFVRILGVGDDQLPFDEVKKLSDL